MVTYAEDITWSGAGYFQVFSLKSCFKCDIESLVGEYVLFVQFLKLYLANVMNEVQLLSNSSTNCALHCHVYVFIW